MNSIDWIAFIILLATIGRQVYTQWRTRSTAGVSKWLFIGQVAASVGFAIYSYLLHNWVFLVSNVALLMTAVLGQWLYSRSRLDTNPRVTNSSFNWEEWSVPRTRS
jgi:MtN3 and saliva related transmembrane protein